VPESLYSPIQQAAIVLASSRQKAIARQFVEMLKTPPIERILQSYGFAIPAAGGR
jgi:ABC-type molybdate transport system substrate-binding protein